MNKHGYTGTNCNGEYGQRKTQGKRKAPSGTCRGEENVDTVLYNITPSTDISLSLFSPRPPDTESNEFNGRLEHGSFNTPHRFSNVLNTTQHSQAE